MPKAAQFAAPDLTSNGVLATAAAKNGWTGSAQKQAQDWYNNFLEAVWYAPAPGTAINVLNRKADDLWHVHKADPTYDAYCMACFGYIVQHIEYPIKRKASAADLALVQPYYRHWPIPDSIVSCHP